MSQHMQAAATDGAEGPAPAEFEFDGQVGAALHHRRRRLGLTATQLARRVGITQRRMARLELRLEPLTLRLALSLGAALDMPAGWLLGVEAAAVPEAIGISRQQAHDHWAQALARRRCNTDAPTAGPAHGPAAAARDLRAWHGVALMQHESPECTAWSVCFG